MFGNLASLCIKISESWFVLLIDEFTFIFISNFCNFDTSYRCFSVSPEKRMKFFCSALDFS